MPSYYWIKLYHEILTDPKMGRLPDNLWRRVIECFLMAGEENNDGHLPPVEDMAWQLRMDGGQLESELEQLALHGILERNGEGWYVTHFAERQAAVPNAERQSNFRDRRRREQYYGTETEPSPPSNEPVTNRVVDTDTDIDKIQIKKGAQKKAPTPTDPRIKTFVEAFQELVGYDLTTWPIEMKAAKSILRGYTVEDALACWRYMTSDPFWQGKHCSLMSVNKNLGPWIKAGKPKTNGKGGKHEGNRRGGASWARAELGPSEAEIRIIVAEQDRDRARIEREREAAAGA